jgi:hypothetical protein
MTAEIAILNTHGVAIAADSALTFRFGENEQKIYNSANKVFALSKYNPIGIMIYNNANFMGIEWEIIVKEYRKILGKKEYKTLFEYAKHFIQFVKEFKLIGKEQEKDFLISLSFSLFTYLKKVFFDNIKKELENAKNITDIQTDKIFDATLNCFEELQIKVPDEKLYKLDIEHLNSYTNEIKKIIKDIFEEYQISKTQSDKLICLLTNEMQKRIGKITPYTGIVITGFGKNEIFPSIYYCNIHGKLGNCLFITNENKEQISTRNSARIIPFAQSEMVRSFMEGIDPAFEAEINKQLTSLFEKIGTLVNSSDKERLDKALDYYFDYIQKFKSEVYINPIMEIVESLQKTELAEMAESLVNLTSFKRHISKESETVGGPIDVAVITKGDGFIWIKRKHYFDIKLNNHFLTNYFQEGGDE